MLEEKNQLGQEQLHLIEVEKKQQKDAYQVHKSVVKKPKDIIAAGKKQTNKGLDAAAKLPLGHKFSQQQSARENSSEAHSKLNSKYLAIPVNNVGPGLLNKQTIESSENTARREPISALTTKEQSSHRGNNAETSGRRKQGVSGDASALLKRASLQPPVQAASDIQNNTPPPAVLTQFTGGREPINLHKI